MQKFIIKPNIDIYQGIVVREDTEMDFENENVTQTLKNLELHTISRLEGKNYKSVADTTVYLEAGDIIIFADEKRGYIFPVDRLVTIEEAIDDLTNIKGVGE